MMLGRSVTWCFTEDGTVNVTYLQLLCLRIESFSAVRISSSASIRSLCSWKSCTSLVSVQTDRSDDAGLDLWRTLPVLRYK